MNKLKQTTINKYSNKQLMRHLDRLDDHAIEKTGLCVYRVDFQNGQIHKTAGDHYFFYCCDSSRQEIISAIYDLYTRLAF